MASATTPRRPTSNKPTTREISVGLPAPPRERGEQLPDLEVYVFDERRRFLSSAPVKDGRAQLSVSFDRSRLVRAIVGPRGMPPQSVLFSTSLPALALETRDLKLIEFPLGWWEGLLFGQLIFYHGRVAKVIGSSELPICEGIVEVYEIDPFAWIWMLPELEIHHLRDDLLKVIDPETILNPHAGPFLERAPHDGHAPMAASTTASHIDTALLSNLQGDALRNHLQLNKHALFPFFCLLRPDWWYSKDKIGEVPIQPDGTFFGLAGWWKPGLDRPDLYFRVRQVINGVERLIYSPAIACNTWWNYAGADVVLRVTDPQAVACNDPLVAQDDQIVFLGLGFDTTTDVAGAPGLVQTGPDVGLYRYPGGKLGPFGSTLHVVLDVDLVGLDAAQLKFFRLSYRRGQHIAVGNPDDWTSLTTPLSRHYRHSAVIAGETVISYPALSLVPGPAELPLGLAGQEGVFKFPEPDHEYVVIDPADRAFGVWNTVDLPTGGETQGDVADVYTLRLEVFDDTGADVTATTPVLRIHEHQADDTYTTTALDPGQPFLYAFVDNRPMVAEINDVITTSLGSSTGTGCGFLTAGESEDVIVGIKAYHPGGLSDPADPDRFLNSWSYAVTRGSAAVTMVAATVYDKNVGNAVSFQNLPYMPDVPVQTVDSLLEGEMATREHGRRCAFSVSLNVYTLTRNGYGTIGGYNASDIAAFALIEG